MLHHQILKTRREHVNKLVHFFLVIQSVLSCKHEFSDFSLDCFRKLHILHVCVHHINLLLKFLASPINALKNGRHSTKNVSIHQSSCYQENNTYPNHDKIRWLNIISTKLKDCIIERKEILNIPILFIKILF